MRAALVVATREVAERARLFPLALAAGLLPLLLPYLGWPAAARVRHELALLGAFAVTTATALLAGGSVVGRDLSERRLGFFLARPLGAFSLWAGKMLGALVLTLATLALASISLVWLGLPSAIATRRSAATAALAVVALIGLGHAAGVGYRSRAPWFALDLVLAAAAAAWAADLGVRRVAHGFSSPVIVIVALTAAALAAAGAAQVAVGRSDARRGHAVLSLVLWGTMLAGVVALEARTRWLFRPSVADLIFAEVGTSAPQGTWAVVLGPAQGHGAMHWAFLADTATGRHGLLGQAPGQALVFAPNGRRAAWVSLEGRRSTEGHLWVVDLDQATLGPRNRPLPERREVAIPIAFSPDSRRLLSLERRAVVVTDVSGSGVPLRVALPEGFTAQAAFRDDRHARLFHNDPARADDHTLRILDLDLATGAIAEVGRLATRGNAWVRVSPDGERLIVIDRPDRRPSLALHAVDGARIASLVSEGAAHGVQADFLADGRIALVQQDPGPVLRVFSPTGDAEQTIALGGRSPSVTLGGEVAPGRLVVGLGGPARHPGEAVLVDLAAGRVVRRQPGVTPVAVRWFVAPDAGSWSRPAPGSAATSLFHEEGGRRVVRVDLTTGAREVVFGAGGGRP
jgi:hypothetical protein